MRPSLKQIEQLELFFSKVEIPDILKVPAGIHHNPAKFFSENIQMLKDGSLKALIAETRYEALVEIMEALKNV